LWIKKRGHELLTISACAICGGAAIWCGITMLAARVAKELAVARLLATQGTMGAAIWCRITMLAAQVAKERAVEGTITILIAEAAIVVHAATSRLLTISAMAPCGVAAIRCGSTMLHGQGWGQLLISSTRRDEIVGVIGAPIHLRIITLGLLPAVLQ